MWGVSQESIMVGKRMVYCIFLLVGLLCYVVGVGLTCEYVSSILLDVPWIHGTFNAFLLRLVCLEPFLVFLT